MIENPGWYRLSDGMRIFVVGFGSFGDVVFQKGFGTFTEIIPRNSPRFNKAVFLPNCDSWHWEEPVPVVQTMGGNVGADGWTGLRLWTNRTVARGDRYVFVAADKGTNDWVEIVFDGKGWQIVD